jgi:DNA-binding HxlR family transcriptional regulator
MVLQKSRVSTTFASAIRAIRPTMLRVRENPFSGGRPTIESHRHHNLQCVAPPKRMMPKAAKVRGSRTGRPIMALLDLMGRRWTLRIVWELRQGPMTSRELRTACHDASPTVMQKRLDELREADMVECMRGSGYRLTSLGEALLEAVRPLSSFADKWSKR